MFCLLTRLFFRAAFAIDFAGNIAGSPGTHPAAGPIINAIKGLAGASRRPDVCPPRTSGARFSKLLKKIFGKS